MEDWGWKSVRGDRAVGFWTVSWLKLKDYLNNPHDKFFKWNFGIIDNTKDFIQEYLPKKLINSIDINQLESCKGSYVDKQLTEHFSDLLFKTKMKGVDTYVYILFEHKSYADNWGHFQLLRNMVKIWEEQQKVSSNPISLNPIIPILIYHGSKPWDFSSGLEKLFSYTDSTKEYIPSFRSEIFDISHLPNHQIKGNELLRASLMSLKYIQRKDLFKDIEELWELFYQFSDKPKSKEELTVIFTYIFNTMDREQTDSFTNFIEGIDSKKGTNMKTIKDQVFHDGRIKGKQEEKAENRVALEKSARKMIEDGLSFEAIHKYTGLPISRIEELHRSMN